MARAEVFVTLRRTMRDAQGATVETALRNLGYANVSNVRIGKFIELDLEGEDAALKAQVEEMCEKLLANPIIEDYRVTIRPTT